MPPYATAGGFAGAGLTNAALRAWLRFTTETMAPTNMNNVPAMIAYIPYDGTSEKGQVIGEIQPRLRCRRAYDIHLVGGGDENEDEYSRVQSASEQVEDGERQRGGVQTKQREQQDERRQHEERPEREMCDR